MTFESPNTGEGAGKLPKPSKTEKQITVHDIARAAYKAAKRDVKRAARIMQRKVSEDAVLLGKLSEAFIEMVCVSSTGAVMRAERRRIWMPPNYDAGGKGDRVKLLAKGNEAMLMAFWLGPVGKPLADATAEEVIQTAESYGTQAKDMAHKARWLRLVAKHVPAGKIVKDALSEKQLRKLQEESGHA